MEVRALDIGKLGFCLQQLSRQIELGSPPLRLELAVPWVWAQLVILEIGHERVEHVPNVAFVISIRLVFLLRD